jgi:hypothetical protein
VCHPGPWTFKVCHPGPWTFKVCHPNPYTFKVCHPGPWNFFRCVIPVHGLLKCVIPVHGIHGRRFTTVNGGMLRLTVVCYSIRFLSFLIYFVWIFKNHSKSQKNHKMEKSILLYSTWVDLHSEYIIWYALVQSFCYKGFVFFFFLFGWIFENHNKSQKNHKIENLILLDSTWVDLHGEYIIWYALVQQNNYRSCIYELLQLITKKAYI